MGITEENRQRNGHVLVWDQSDLPVEDTRPKSKHGFFFVCLYLLFFKLFYPIHEITGSNAIDRYGFYCLEWQAMDSTFGEIPQERG